MLGLKGAKPGLRFPKWQVTSDGGLLPNLPRLFKVLRGESWTVYRFLTQHHPKFERNTALSALQSGKVAKVFAAAENCRRRSGLTVTRAQSSNGFEWSQIEWQIRTGASRSAPNIPVAFIESGESLAMWQPIKF